MLEVRGSEFVSNSPDETWRHGFRTAEECKVPLILLCGQMGAGKTLWTKGFAAGFGITESVFSPTYAILNVYGSGSQVLYHFDLYRIENLGELVDTGLFEILQDGLPCVIEWADKIEALFRMPHLRITLNYSDNTESRKITCEYQIEKSEKE